jgi:hypothetical protein
VRAFDSRPPANNRFGAAPTMVCIPAYYPNAVSRQQTSPVDVRVGEKVEGIDIHLSKSSLPARVHIRGRITGLPRDSRIMVFVAVRSVDDGGLRSSGEALAHLPTMPST